MHDKGYYHSYCRGGGPGSKPGIVQPPVGIGPLERFSVPGVSPGRQAILGSRLEIRPGVQQRADDGRVLVAPSRPMQGRQAILGSRLEIRTSV